MQNLNDEKLFKLVEEHFGVTYYACDDAVLHDETGHYHSAYPYRAFAQDVIDVALKDLALDAARIDWLEKSTKINAAGTSIVDGVFDGSAKFTILPSWNQRGASHSSLRDSIDAAIAKATGTASSAAQAAKAKP